MYLCSFHGMGYLHSNNLQTYMCVKSHICIVKKGDFLKKVNLDNAMYLQILVSLLGKEGSYFLNKNCCFLRPSAFIFSFSWSCLRGLIALMGFTPRGALSLLQHCTLIQVSVMREINLFESLCLYRNLAACQLFSFNVLCVEHRQAGMLLYSSLFWSLSLSANILLYGF